MKNNQPYFIIAFVVSLSLACSFTDLNVRTNSAAQLAPTRTPVPTFTSTPEVAPETPTPIIPTDTPTLLPPTDTPVPTVTNTPVVVPTDTPVPEPTATNTAPPPPTNTPQPPPPPTNTPVPAGPAIGQFGVSGKVIARDKTTFAVGEKAFFTYEANNHTENPVSFTLLGIKASNGHFNTSWINPDVIVPGVPFRHDDGLTFTVPGTYQVFLAICYFSCDAGADAVWEEYPDGAATITVQ
ncbi:MAG: hypothetical protein AAF629_14690 [Chloroflexota bacterium]